jgi:hypothetical protein
MSRGNVNVQLERRGLGRSISHLVGHLGSCCTGVLTTKLAACCVVRCTLYAKPGHQLARAGVACASDTHKGYSATHEQTLTMRPTVCCPHCVDARCD